MRLMIGNFSRSDYQWKCSVLASLQKFLRFDCFCPLGNNDEKCIDQEPFANYSVSAF